MGIKLLANDDELKRIFRDAAVKKLRNEFFTLSKVNNIKSVVSELILNRIRASRTWISILNGTGDSNLRAHFGIPKGEESSRLNAILGIWAKEIVVRPNSIILRSNDRFVISYDFFAIKADWAEVLNSKDGITPNNSKNPDAPKEIPWLRWLLVAGDQLEINGYFITPIKEGGYPRSRSGSAVMRKPKDGVSASWVMPKEFAPFNTDNNFVMQELNKLSNDKSFRSSLVRIFKGDTSINDIDVSSLLNEI